MTRRLALWILCLCLSWIPASAGLAADGQTPEASPEVREILSRLEERLSGIQTVQADFVQEKHLVVLEKPLLLKGTLFMQKPDRFAWIVREPLRYSMVIRGEVAHQWDEDTRRVEKIPLSKNPVFKTAMRQLQSWLSGAYTSMIGEYEVTVLARDPITLEFIPRDAALAHEVIERVTVEFDHDERYIRRIEILERRGDRTVLTFVNTRLNSPIESSAWKVKQDVR